MKRFKGMTGKRKVCLWRLALVLYLCMVYGHSMMPAHISSGESGAVLGLLRRSIGVLGLDGEMLTQHMVRKAAHFTEYVGVGILLWGNLGAERRCLAWREGTRVCLMERAALAVLAIPFADETIQLFVAGRSGQISDVWLDMAGAAAGLLAAWLLARRKEKSRDEL